MKLWVKIGTHSANEVNFPRKRKEPKVGDRVQWVERKNGPLESGVVDEIREILGRKLFFIARM